MDPIEIQLATSDDLTAILKLNINEYWQNVNEWDEASQANRIKIGSWWGDDRILGWHWDILLKSDGGIIIAKKDNQVIGELDFVKSIDIIDNQTITRIHVIWLLVDKIHRKEGVAEKLIEYLKSIVNGIPIFVEAEDERTTNLYEKLGRQALNTSNWSLETTSEFINEYFNSEINETELSNNIIFDFIHAECIIGRYHAPSFDLNQLVYSDISTPYIWGDGIEHLFYKYSLNFTQCFAVITQYPRIYVETGFVWEDLKLIIPHIFARCMIEGFSSIEIQIYENKIVNKLLLSIGSTLLLENDPVYQII
ncbi:MAG: GNAT family N-acetyltransferase [Candidatus Heimdallarchaeota archaeon]|nr:GNAT family N-acetyltransferase [Candidatus Heimdallarchaeota archaeon]